MIAELDPDLRLHARLALGRGWYRIALLAFAVVGVLALMSMQYWLVARAGGPAQSVPGFLDVGLFLLMFAPSRAVARLLELEQRGLLDQMRLCGRPPHRLLAAFLIGSMWPYVAAGVILVANHLRVQFEPHVLLLVLIAFVGVLDVSLAVYSAFPTTTAMASGLVTPVLLVVTVLAMVILRDPGGASVIDAHSLAITAVMFALLPGALFLALRRVKRPAAGGAESPIVVLVNSLSRLLPNAGPPEFNRLFRGAMGSAAVTAAIFMGGGGALIVAQKMGLMDLGGREPLAWSTWLHAFPWFSIGISMFVVSGTIRRERTAAFLDLVRLTSQRAETVAVSWYAGAAGPFWTVSLLAFALGSLLNPSLAYSYWALIGFAAIMPAIGLVEGIQGRRLGGVVALIWGMAVVVMLYRVVLDPRTFELASQLDVALEAGSPWGLNLQAIASVSLVALSLGVVVGRIRRPIGPPLSGGAVVAGTVAAVLSARLLPMAEYPRVLPGLLALLASFAAREGVPLTAPWRRVGLGSGAALAATMLVCHAGGLPWSASSVTGAAAALALGMGLLTHELTWQMPALSVAIRLSMLFPVVRMLVRFLLDLQAARRPILSPLLDPIDIAWIAAACATAAMLHTRTTSRSSRS